MTIAVQRLCRPAAGVRRDDGAWHSPCYPSAATDVCSKRVPAVYEALPTRPDCCSGGAAAPDGRGVDGSGQQHRPSNNARPVPAGMRSRPESDYRTWVQVGRVMMVMWTVTEIYIEKERQREHKRGHRY